MEAGQPARDLDRQRQQQARCYAGLRRRLMLVDLALGAALVLGLLFGGASRALRDVLVGAGVAGPWALVAAFFAILLAGYELVTLPLGYYSGFTLPHRFGLSTQTTGGWLLDQLKGLGLSLVLGIPVLEVVYALLRALPQAWWIPAAAFMILVNLVASILAPILFVPIFYRLKPLDDPALIARIRRLAERARVRIAGVYTINLSSRTTAANAMFMGLGRTKRIALGDTLYAGYDADEIETIVAHELGHQVQNDVLIGFAVQSGVTLLSLYLAHLLLAWGVAQMGFAGPSDVAASPLLAIAAGAFSLLTMPALNAYSRWREGMADHFALVATGNGPAFARAMIRLANQNLAEADPPRWVVWLLYSHPPIRERVRAAEAFGSRPAPGPSDASR